MKFVPFFALLTTFFLMHACAPQFKEPENKQTEPHLSDTTFVSFDKTALPLKAWLPTTTPKAVIIALHGYNDYSNFIRDAASYLNDHEIGIYAYDQRGFGGAPHRGWWLGHETMGKDLKTIIALVQKRHPEVPLYLLGDSMGGAVILVADQPDDPLPGDGVILVAPAVWSRDTMPFYQRWLLWLAARTIPGVRLTGKQLDLTPSDNKEMLIALGRDPLVIKESRVDSIYGLTNLMDAAYEAAARFNKKALFLYGAQDEIIPSEPMSHVFRQRLNGHFSSPQRFLVYANGYHMLLRDIQAQVVWKDILFWMNSPLEPFPSVRDNAAHEITSDEDIKFHIYPGSEK